LVNSLNAAKRSTLESLQVSRIAVIGLSHVGARLKCHRLWPNVGGLQLSPLARHHHVDLTAAALRAHKPLAAFEDGHLSAVAPGLLDLMLAFLAP
jgi:hypothetical protein